MLSRLLLAAAAAGAAATDCTFASSYPRQYIAYAASAPPTFDGTILGDPWWDAVPFSQPFVDISTNYTPGKTTMFKLRYDENFLYIGAYVQDNTIWANITSTCHCLDPNHDQVIYHDNDFEIFIDADGSTHGYKETEINAAAASWDLLLNKPYNDGGGENSTRVYGPAGFDMFPPQGTAKVATYVTGTLSDPTTPHTYWTAEIALPFNKLVVNTTATAPPSVGDMWRINFSRVEWGVQVVQTTNGSRYWLAPSCTTCPIPGTVAEDNWVWSPQGSIAMHLPERWGFLQFADTAINQTQPVTSPEWPVRQVAMALYYAQHAYAGAPAPAGGNGTYTASIAALLPYTPDTGVLNGTCTVGLPVISLGPGGTTFTATLSDGTYTASIRDDRYLLVQKGA